jgi:predicted metalloprotease with PDZ domain
MAHKPLACLILFAAFSLGQEAGTIQVKVDARDAPRRLYHVRMTIPAKPGPMTLLYPQWIPGEHGPTGPITDLVGLKISSSGTALPWKRDSVNMYAFHIDAPAGASTLEADFDFISPTETSGFSSGASATTELAVVSWNQLLLYPEGVPSDQLRFQAGIRVPASWRYGTALPIEKETGDEIQFKPSSLTTLVDSPISMGAHYRTIELGKDGNTPHYLHIAADGDAATNLPPAIEQGFKNLVQEAGAIFGSRHYRDYHFLLTLSDHVAHFGLEHHESSDDRVSERTFLDESGRKVEAGLLPHEFVHSWNGKFRRPAGLATADYQKPMQGDLLWVYEGLTEYLGEILTPRSSLTTPEEFREDLAIEAAKLDRKTGRAWRPLEDTAVAAQLLYEARSDYADYRRGTDYYPEGTLIWLEADVMIRQLSKGTKSLDDFCRSFHGGPGGAPDLKPYTFDDIVTALNGTQPYDWAGFLHTRLTSTSPHAPLGGIENGGWKLTYTAEPSSLSKAHEEFSKNIDLMFSLGMLVKEDGTIVDVALGGPTQLAGVAPSAKLIAINRREFTPTELRGAVGRTPSATGPLELLVKDGDYYNTIKVDYHGGHKYPHLERDSTKPDLLTQIIAPKTKR